MDGWMMDRPKPPQKLTLSSESNANYINRCHVSQNEREISDGLFFCLIIGRVDSRLYRLQCNKMKATSLKN